MTGQSSSDNPAGKGSPEKDQIDNGTGRARQNGDSSGKAGKPEWADGLRQLYDSVVDEPLPDSFNDLLAKLDDPPQDGSSSGGSARK